MLFRSAAWTYIAEGEITAVTPAAGQGNTRVTITGKSLFGGADDVKFVTFSGVGAFVDKVRSNTQLVAVTFALPANVDSGPGDVVVMGSSGVVVRKVNAWSYSKINAVSPAFGQRGTIIRIEGVSLAAGGAKIMSVELASVPVLAILSRSSTHVEVVARSHSVDKDTVGDIVLFSDSKQEVRLENAFTYKVAGAINKVVPHSGQQGTVVDIRGVDLFGHGAKLAKVKLVGTEVAEIAVNTNTHVQVITALAEAGAGDIELIADTGVTVMLVDGTAKNELRDGKWEYVAKAVINKVYPALGQFNTRVTISGSGLFGGGSTIKKVTLSNADVVAIEKNTDSELVVVASATPASTLCPTYCHGSCETCVEQFPNWDFASRQSQGAEDCKTCPEATTLSAKGTCVSPCKFGTYRGPGVVDVTAELTLPGLFLSIFNTGEQKTFESVYASVVNSALTALKAQRIPKDAKVVVSIVKVAQLTSPTRLTVNAKVTAEIGRASCRERV